MTRSRTPLVDVHAHFVTDDYMAAAITAGYRRPDGMSWPAWDAGQNLRLMDQCGVAAAALVVVLPTFGAARPGASPARRQWCCPAEEAGLRVNPAAQVRSLIR